MPVPAPPLLTPLPTPSTKRRFAEAECCGSAQWRSCSAPPTLALTQEQIGDRLAILTNGGAAGVLAAEALTAAGGHLATLSKETISALGRLLPASSSRGNPLDILGDASGKRYADALAVLIGDREVDAILALNCPTGLAQPDEAARAVIGALKAADPTALRGRNVITAWLGEYSARPARQLFTDARIATYESPDGAVNAFMNRVCHRNNQELLMQRPPARTDAFEADSAPARRVIAAAIAAGKSLLDQQEIGVVFAAYGLRLVPSYLAADPSGAAATAASVGFPVALKVCCSDIRLKSEVGGVALNLGQADRIRQEAIAMLERVRSARPEARLDGFLIQPMVLRPGAMELRAGIVEDPVFGPLVTFGQGGALVEIQHDSSLELPPLNSLLARRLMARTRVWRLLHGYRGQQAANIEAVVELLIRLGQLDADHPEIRELEINPLLADADGTIVLDARLRVARATSTGAAQLAIAPYPQDLASVEQLRDGTGFACARCALKTSRCSTTSLRI
jgi:acetyltransferase